MSASYLFLRPAIIGSLSANVQGKRLAGAHLIFNTVTGVIAIAFISQFILAVDLVSDKVGIAADNYTMKLAVFHTLFNLTGVIVMVPLMQRLADNLVRYFPERKLDVAEPIYLNDAAFEFPETVLKSVKQEVWHLFDSAFEVLAHGMNLHRTQILESEDLKKTIDEDREVHEFDLDEVLAKTEELAPRLPVEYAVWNSPRANRWIAQEDPDWTQFGPTDNSIDL